MVRSFWVALLEVRSYLRDKGDLAFSLLLPIAIFLLMYGAFGGQSIFHGTASVVNEDGGTYSILFLDNLGKLDSLDVQLISSEEADTKLEKSDLLLVIDIPQGFSDKLASGQPAQLIFKQRGNGGQEGQIVASLVRGVAEEMGQELQVKNQVKDALQGRNISPEHIDVTVQKYLDQQNEAPVVSVAETTVGVQVNIVQQFLPGIITMFVLFALTLTGRAILKERKKGTLERLLTTQLTVGQLFFGKFLANVARGFVQSFILLALAYAAFRIFTPLTFVESLVIALIFSAAASVLGLIIAAIARSEAQASWIAVAFTMITVMLGGTFFAISKGSALYTISKISINTYANDAFKTIIAQGGSLANLGLELSVMAGVIVVGLILSRLIFKSAPGGG